MPAKRDRQRKDQIHLKNPLEKRIKDYSLAAVGIGAVTFAPAAHAAVVSTVLNKTLLVTDPVYTVTIGGHNIFKINNNNVTGGTTNSASVTAYPIGTAKIFVAHKGAKAQDTLFNLGQAIPGLPASSTPSPVFVRTYSSRGGDSAFFGSLGDRYLGFTFTDGMGLHHGWVEIIIGPQAAGQAGTGIPFTLTVVRGAYETAPGVPLAASATTDNSTPPATPAPNSLWLMALGAAGLGGLELLRRRRTA